MGAQAGALGRGAWDGFGSWMPVGWQQKVEFGVFLGGGTHLQLKP